MTVIKLNKNNRTIVVKRSPKKEITIVQQKPRVIEIIQTGKRGRTGENGMGVPTGGTVGQLLVKKSNTDFDTVWSTESAVDKNYILDFTVQGSLDIDHNLNKYPTVSIIDTAGDLVEGSVRYLNENSITVSFSSPFSGRVICN